MTPKSIKRMVNRLYEEAFSANDGDHQKQRDLDFCRRLILDFVDKQPYEPKDQDELIAKFFAEPINPCNIKKLLDDHERLLITGMIGD